MINAALVKKCVSEAKWLLVACLIYVFGFSILRVFIVSEFDTETFKMMLELLPDTFKSLTPVDGQWLISYTGRIALGLDEPMLVACIAVWAIARGSDVVSGEVSRGTMEMVLSQPLSRRNVFGTQSAVTLLGMVLIVGTAWLAMAIAVQICSVKEFAPPRSLFGIPMEFLKGNSADREYIGDVNLSDHVNTFAFWPGMLNMVCFGFFLCALTAMFSAFDRFRWRTIGIVSGIYTVMAALKLFAEMSFVQNPDGSVSQSWNWLLWFTFFTCYEPEVAIADFETSAWSVLEILKYSRDGSLAGLGAMGHNLTFVVMGVCCYAVGVTQFKNRDLPAPL